MSGVPPPLHVDPEQPLPTEQDPLLEAVRRRHRDVSRIGDNFAGFLASTSAASLAVFTWILVFRNNPRSLGCFAFHPPLQTLALVLFVFAILNLQRTALTNPESKRRGQIYHQLLGTVALVSITLGSTAMIVNKASYGWRHFTSWHARFGLLTYVLLVIQAFVGAGSLWFNGAVFGGGERAKAVYKYHRLHDHYLDAGNGAPGRWLDRLGRDEDYPWSKSGCLYRTPLSYLDRPSVESKTKQDEALVNKGVIPRIYITEYCQSISLRFLYYNTLLAQNRN
ncbi:hypothetical protein M407DRAFT_20649 [Tulasnella calospora MUT 4182]|uniref:Cytochrome b561 domain-containing protein n=1 Tax=Tulasnella calospora MUT 4182 TaxID=1051891 RepID=A0A0C3QPG7_9AGAM|nr:hypothetical protein M407DRAFT_20649 [Tulasnella calospora MUT 4182]